MYTKDIDIFAKLMTSIETYILFQKHEQEWFCASYVNVLGIHLVSWNRIELENLDIIVFQNIDIFKNNNI